MSLQISASKVGLLLQCPRPFSEEIETESHSGDAANYGSALHEAMATDVLTCDFAALVQKWGVKVTAEELEKHTRRTADYLMRFLEGDPVNNPWGCRYEIESSEKHIAWDPKIPHAFRECGFEEKTHKYDLLPGEVGGTPDLILTAEQGDLPAKVVVDFKTGDSADYSQPKTLPQMLTLACMFDADAVAILHTPRGMAPAWFCQTVSAKEKKRHIRKLIAARSKIGKGFLREGIECRYCEARHSCPTKQGDLIIRADALVKRVTGSPVFPETHIDRGRFHMMLSELNALASRARELIRAEVEAGAVIERPDGKILTLESRTYERLSKSSVIEAYGKKEGEKVLNKLRRDGALKEDERLELRAK